MIKLLNINKIINSYSGGKYAYHLSANLSHRITMTLFLDGALDDFERTIKRVIAMDGVYAAFAGAKSCPLRNLGSSSSCM